MTNTYQLFLVLFFTYLFLSCGSSNVSSPPPPGKYATYRPGYGPGFFNKLIRIKNRILLEHKYKKDFKGMVVVTLCLRADSTFVYAHCNDEIILAGNYVFKKDSLILFNVYDFRKKENLPEMRLYVDGKDESIYLVHSNISEPPGRHPERYKYKERVTVLQHNKYMHHRPVLRNETMSLDSLLKYNEIWPHDKQMQYFDSIQRSFHN